MDESGDNEGVDWTADVAEEELKHDAITSENESLQSLLCEPCLFEKNECVAAGFCKNCPEYLCEECIREHKKAKLTRGHVIIEDSLPSEPDLVKNLKELICCKDHPENKITFKCAGHDVFICSICIAEIHRKCELVPISKQIGAENYQDAFTILDELAESAETSKQKTEHLKASVVSDQECVQSEIEKHVQTTLETVHKLGEKKYKELQEITSTRLSDIETDLKKCYDLIDAAIMNRKLLEISLCFCDEKDFQVVHQIVLEKFKALGEDLQRINETEHSEIVFKNEDFPLDVFSIGKIEVRRPGDDKGTYNLAQSSDEVQENKAVEKSTQIKFEDLKIPVMSAMERKFDNRATVFSVKHAADRYLCSICAITVLSDGSVVLLDNSNSSIKVFKEEVSFLSAVFNLDDNPTDLCKLDEDRIAVSFLNSKKIDRFEIDNLVISYEGGFKTRLYNLSLAKYFDQIAILMSDLNLNLEKDTSIDTIEVQFRDPQTGQCFTTLNLFFSGGVSTSPLYLFNPVRIRFNDQNELLILEQDDLSCFEYKKGSDMAKTKWYYKPKHNSNEFNMASVEPDEDSAIFCSKRGLIGQISSLNFRNKRLLETNIVSPMCLYLDREKKRLLVGCVSDNYVHSYQYE